MSNRTEAAQRKLRQLPPGDYRHCVLDSTSYNDTDHPGAIFARQLESNISMAPSESAFCDKRLLLYDNLTRVQSRWASLRQAVRFS